MEALPALCVVLYSLAILTQSALINQLPSTLERKLITRNTQVLVGHVFPMKGLHLNMPRSNVIIHQNWERIKRNIQGYPPTNMIQNPKNDTVINHGGTCCNSINCYPCPSPGGAMMMPYGQPQMMAPPMTIYPGSMVYQPVVHDHPHPSKIMRMMKRDKKSRRRHHKHRHSDSDDDSSSGDRSDSHSHSRDIDYYDDTMHLKRSRRRRH